MKKIIISITIIIVILLVTFILVRKETEVNVLEHNLDLLPEMQTDEPLKIIGADIVSDKCPACPVCPTLTLRELIKEKIVELDPIGESSNRTYKINDTSNYKLMLDDGKIYEKDQLIEITPVSINK